MESTSLIVMGILFFIILVLAGRLGQAHLKIEEQNLQLLRAQNVNVINNLHKLINNAEDKKPQISQTTESLISLAVNNTNEHEAASAALKACKRIHKELGYK